MSADAQLYSNPCDKLGFAATTLVGLVVAAVIGFLVTWVVCEITEYGYGR